MKNIGKIVVAFILCLTTVFAFVGCKNKMTPTTNATDGVSGNGTIAVTYNDYLYFFNGTNDISEAGKSVVRGSICKAKLDADGEVLLDGSGNYAEVSTVVDSVAGFKNGKIYIFGSYIYYATPNSGKNKSGTMLNNQVCFMRKDLTNGQTQKLFTTSQNSSSETIEYAYYKQGDALYLLVYEKSQTKLTSIKIDENVKVNVITSDAQSVIFGENCGDVKNVSNNSFAENYVFFTRSALETGKVRTGTRVYKVLPDGSNEKLISEGVSLSLICVRGDKLVFSKASATDDSVTVVYAQAITTADDTLSATAENVITNKSYSNIVFTEENDGIGVLYYDSKKFCYVKTTNGEVAEPNTENNKTIYQIVSDEEQVSCTFLTISGDYAYYVTSSLIYKIKYKNVGATEIVVPEKISTTTCQSPEGNLVPKVVGDYIYFFNTTSNKVQLYRASTVTKSSEGTLLEVKEAKLFGIAG